MGTKRYYIAYGSNMNLEQMAQRCPNAKLVGATYLTGWTLRFKGGLFSSVATVEPSDDDRVPVVMWELQPEDEANLDIYEGWPRLYRKEVVNVTIGEEKHLAMIYIMNGQHYPYGNPSQGYYQTIREGYDAAGFDPAFLFHFIRENAKGVNKHDTED